MLPGERNPAAGAATASATKNVACMLVLKPMFRSRACGRCNKEGRLKARLRGLYRSGPTFLDGRGSNSTKPALGVDIPALLGDPASEEMTFNAPAQGKLKSYNLGRNAITNPTLKSSISCGSRLVARSTLFAEPKTSLLSENRAKMVAIDSSIVSGAPASSSSVPAWLAGVISSKKIQTECSYSQGSTALCQNLRHPTASVRTSLCLCDLSRFSTAVVAVALHSEGGQRCKLLHF